VTQLTDYFRIAIGNLAHRRTRSLLTMVGIFIGIAAVVGLISIGDGLQKAVVGEFEKMGSDKITIMAGAGGMGDMMSSMGGLSDISLTEKDVKNLEKVRGVKLVDGLLYKRAGVEYRSEKKVSFVIAIPTGSTQKIFEDMEQVNLAQGRKLGDGDDDKVLIGSYAADGLFEKDLRTGSKITISNKEFQVVGILESMGNRKEDSSVYITLDAGRKLFDEPETVSMIYAQVTPGSNPSEVAERIEEKLRKTRHEEEGEETFSVLTSEQLVDTFNSMLAVVQAMLVGIAAISLLVGGVGIMNTMYTSVLERTKQIGIMKAIGASNNDILSIFLIESGLLGVVGGGIGVLLGMGLGKITEIVAEQALGTELLKASFSLELVVGALLFSFIIGSVSGVLPAKQAASMKPVDALRYK